MFRVLWHIMLHGSVKGQIPKSTGNKAILTPKRALILPENIDYEEQKLFWVRFIQTSELNDRFYAAKICQRKVSQKTEKAVSHPK